MYDDINEDAMIEAISKRLRHFIAFAREKKLNMLPGEFMLDMELARKPGCEPKYVKLGRYRPEDFSKSKPRQRKKGRELAQSAI